MQELTTTRANPLIDPVLHAWHGEVALYLFLGGIVAGLMVITGLWALRRTAPRSRALAVLPWAAPVLLSVGMLFLFLDLEHPANVFRFYFAFQVTSPMSWGSWILVAIYPVTAAFALATTPDAIRTAATRRLPGQAVAARIADAARPHLRRLAWATVALGVALGLYTGILLGTLAARPLWNSAILGPLFLVSGLSTGAALMLLFRLSPGERVALSRIDMGLIGVELALIALWLGGLLAGGGASRDAAALLLGGPYTTAFLTLVVITGLLVPLAFEWFEHHHRLIPGRFTALLVLAGGLALRWILVSAGQTSDWALRLAAR